MCESNNQATEDVQMLNEKVSEILAKLDSICYEEKMLGKSEQFVLGIKASADVICSYFYGDKNKK